ncbi:hypothetical protein MFIFM68171_03604 [Madurella fahalii]|uniref:Major facilitator superfamily (MFS) profile domain-containing protein n=1 Tax=Madurella fahalii TaxID=1157608 RepID=A0ABQ0G6V9_9PEZI
MSALAPHEPFPGETSEKASHSPTEANSESAKPDSVNLNILSPAPDGGLRAWFVVAGAASIFFSCLGFLNSFGVFQEYYMANQLRDWTPDAIAWIGSLSAFIQFAAGAIAGPLFDRYGVWVVRPGAVLYVFSLMLISICSAYWHFMLVQGVVTGIAMAMLQLPAIAAVSQYFDKRRAAALGVVISGSSIGGIVFPIALSKMLNDSPLGFGWSVRIIGFVVAPLLALSCFTVTARLPPRETDFFIGSAFKRPRYLLLIFSLFCAMAGMFTPLFFLPSYAVTRGVDTTLASYLLAIVNGASTFGRIVPGILADKYGRLNVFGLGALATGVVVFCMNSAVNKAGLIVYSVAFGFTSGTIVSGVSAAISTCTDDPRELGTYMGMGMAIGSIASLIGPPVNGVLVATYGGFLQASIFSGVMCFAGGVTVLGTKAITPQGLFGRA